MKIIEKKLNEYPAIAGFQCPAEFWPALGYNGDARYVGIYWEPSGDEASYHDGRTGLCGAEWVPYLTLIRFNLDNSYDTGNKLGSSESPATHWLIIDRVTEWAWLVPVKEAEQTLRLQWPPQDNAPNGYITLTPEDLEELVRNLQRIHVPLDTEKIEAAMEQSAADYRVFEEALAKRKKVKSHE